MSGGFFRGTSADQDTRFSNKQAKLMKTQKFPAELEQLVDMTKVKMDVIRPWIATRVTELLGFEDEVLINFIYGLLDGKEVNGKEVQIQLTGFMEKNTGKFMKELWILLLSAQKNASGVPQQLLDAKEEEIRKKKAETDFLANEIQKKREKESREVEDQRLKKMDDGAERVADAALEPSSKTVRSRAIRNLSEDEEENGKRNGVRGRSSDRDKSRSTSRSPRRLGHSFSRGRLSHSPPRMSTSPLRRGRHDSFSPRHRLSYSRRRSRSTSHHKSPSPTFRQLYSPSRHSPPSSRRNSPRSSPSPEQQRPSLPVRRRSPSSTRHSRSPSSMRRRRSPSPVRRRRSPSPRWRRRSPALVRRRRSPSPIRHRRSPSPVRHRRSPPPMRRRRSPSLTRRYRSPSPTHRRRSPSLARRRRSPSPARHRRSPLAIRRHKSRSPMQRHVSSSSSPVRQLDRPSSLIHRRTPSPVQRRSPLPTRRGKPPPTPLSKSPVPQRLSPMHHKRSLTPAHRRSLSPYDPSSSSMERGAPSPVKRKSGQHQRRSPIQTPEDRTRNIQGSSPMSRQPSRSTRSPFRDSRELNNSSNRIRAPSSSLEKSPPLTESPPVTRSLNNNGFGRSSSPRSRAKQSHLANHSTTKGEEETTYAREGGNLEPRSSLKRPLNSSIVGKMKDSPADVSYKVPSPESEKHNRRRLLGTPDRQKFSSSHKERLLVEEQPPLHSIEGLKHNENSQSHLNKVKESGFHRSDSVVVTVEKVDPINRGGSSDSDLEEVYKRRTGSKEKKRHKRSDRKETSSDSDDSYDTELERKEARKRKKEERRLRKEKKRQRREERRHKKEERRAEKKKAKNLNDTYSDDERVAKDESYPSDGVDKSEHRKLEMEIELRNKALESFNARKGTRH